MADQPGSAPLKRVDSYQFPNAHDGHLTDEQKELLWEFKKLCEHEGYYTPADPRGKPASHDDETLLRFLRARKFVPKDAIVQFKTTEDWRRDNEIDKLYNTIDIEEYDETSHLYPQWTGRRDKRGIPVYVFEVAGLTSKRMRLYNQSLASKPRTTHSHISANMLRLFALSENLIQFAMPLCSAIPLRPYHDTPVSQSNNIVDISGVGLKQFWDLKGHMQEGSTLATAHYPETLDRIFIIGAPSFFPTVWGWIKRWFDPVTVAKIFVLSSSTTKSTLEQFIDPDNIPKKYGGNLEWDWGDRPFLEPDVESTVKWIKPMKNQQGRDSFPIGPIRWRNTKAGDALEAVALGTVDGRQREEVVAEVPRHSGLAMQRVVPAGHSFSGKPAAAAAPAPADADADAPTAKLNTGLHADHTTLDRRADEHPDAPDGDAPPPSAALAPTESAHSADALSTRQGTSNSRFEAQDRTHAAGKLAHGTPEVVQNEAGDKTAVVEPRTIGQAPKDVSVPERAPDAPPADASYVGQARAAAGGVVSGAAAYGGSLLSAVGLGRASTEAAPPATTPAVDEEAERKKRAAHAAVDAADSADVEDFIRSKYASGAAGKS